LDIISKLHRIAERVKTVADSIQLPEEADTKVDMVHINFSIGLLR